MSELPAALADLPATPRMPAVFVGHGNPMFAIEDSEYGRAWRALGESLPAPRAILVVSAHWMTRGVTMVHIGAKPKTIHDFGGFPRELFRQQYPAPGAPDVAQATIELVKRSHLEPDERWGLDHGAWAVLLHMFPKADVPVFQLSLDLSKSPAEHFELAKELKALRERGVLVIGSGNLVHNLMAMNPGAPPYDWAVDFDTQLTKLIEAHDFRAVADDAPRLPSARYAHPTPEHFLPVLYPLALADPKDEVKFFNASFDMASLSMRSFTLS
jgi:4,5-DOPA dioxygenase extradiol